MAGNALTAAMFSVGKGNTGVGKPTETLSSIDKGIKDVGTWAKGIEDEKQKLKTDTAKKYREAELKAYENMPSNETEKANMIKGLASYKDQLYMNMKLVQNGNIDSKDNLIFQENGKQSFDILSQVIKSYGEERDLTMKRAKGYTDKDGTVVPPTSGGVEAALQDLQSRLGNPQFSEITFDEKGMGGVTFFETEIDEETDTRVIKRDAKGEPIIQKGMGSLSVLAFNKGRNQRAERVYLDKAAQGFIGKETALGQAYQIMEGINKGMAGNVTDDQRQKSRNQLNQLLDQAASTITSSNDSVSSILSDNGPLEERSIPINSIQAEELKSSGVNLDEQISYSYIDSDGVTQPGKKSKYIIQKVSQNNQIVSVLSAEDKQAAVNMAKSQLYSQLGRKVDAGTKVTTFDSNSASKLARKNNVKDASSLIGAINTSYGGDKKDVKSSITTLQASSNYKFKNQKDVKNEDGVITGISMTVVDANGNTRTDIIPLKTEVDGKLVNVSNDQYMQPMYELFKSAKGPSYREAKNQFLKDGTLYENQTETSREYTPKTTKEVTTETVKGINMQSPLTKDGKTSISSIIKDSLSTVANATFNASSKDGFNLANAIKQAIGAASTAYGDSTIGEDIIKTISSKGDKLLINGEEIDLEDENTVTSNVNRVIESITSNLYPKVEGSTKTVTTQGGESNKRTIAQIMKEDGVTTAEAAKIFKAQ